MSFSSQRPYLWLVGVLAVVGLVADLASKYVVFTKLYPSEPTQEVTSAAIVPSYFELRTGYSDSRDPGDEPLSFLRTIAGERLPHVNRGALFGLGNSGNGLNLWFAAVSVLAACFILAWASRPIIARDRFLCVALGLILGGTLGNLYDRMVFSGVRDFLHIDLGFWPFSPWPDFNIADVCLVCGAGVLLAHSIFVSDTADQPTPSAPLTAEPTATMQATSSTPGV